MWIIILLGGSLYLNWFVSYSPTHPQGRELHHNVTGGVILSDQSLVLQSVTKEFSGDYTCQATNTEGRSSSNAVTLRVRCKYIGNTFVSIELKFPSVGLGKWMGGVFMSSTNRLTILDQFSLFWRISYFSSSPNWISFSQTPPCAPTNRVKLWVPWNTKP